MVDKTVLIIDDQAGIRSLLREVFSVFGFKTIEAQDGYRGLEQLEARQPDIILLDMKMPGLSGIETLRKIRAVDTKVPVILVTAYQELEMIHEAERLGVSVRLIKPFDLEELQRIVSQVAVNPEFQVAGND